MQKKEVHAALGNLIIGYLVSIAYITALTFLIPLLLVPEVLIVQVPLVVKVCIGVMVLCALVMFWLKKDFGLALISLGYATVIPGILGMLFRVFGSELFLQYLARLGPDAEAIARDYIQQNVPTIWFIMVGYIVVGALLCYWGSKITRRKNLVADIRRQFGPRAKIRV